MTTKGTFDHILEEKLGFGRYQVIAILFLCLVDFCDGVELLSMSLIMPIIKKEWVISNFWVEVLSSIFYFGMLIGALLTGRLSDKIGRKITILYSSMIQFLVGFSFCFINNLFLLLLLRFLYGFCYGFSLPLTISIVSEILPLKYRGKCIVFTNFCVSIGKVYGIIIAWIVLKDLNSGNWRLLMVLCSLTSLVVVYGMVFHVKESPRFLLSVERYDEGIELINEIGKLNDDKYVELTMPEITELVNSQKIAFNKDEQANPMALFSNKNLGITLRLWVLWFALIFIEFGQYVILPFLLISQNSGFGTLILAIVGELPSIFFSLYFIDMKNLGRRNTLTLCVAALGFLNFVAFNTSTSFLGLIISLERFFMKNCFSMLVPLTSELYPTNYRTIGYGFATGMGRFAATICPYILLPLFYYDAYSSFMLFSILCAIATYSSMTIPFDTSGKYLDCFIELENKAQVHH